MPRDPGLHLVEGASPRSITRLTGIHRTTVIRLMLTVGEKCRTFLDAKMRNLRLNHIECDEIWTFVQKKQGRLEGEEKHNPFICDMYLYTALDQETKIMPSFAIGKRSKEMTDLFMDDLASRIVTPDLFSGEPKPQISTDGWQAYPDAIDGAFGGTVAHGVLIKNYAAHEQPGRYGPPTTIGTKRKVISGKISKLSICTSHVERNNLSIRTFLRRFTRLSLGFLKKLANLAAAVALHVAHYNFCRRHETNRMTPAMKAGIVGHPWTLEELLDAVS